MRKILIAALAIIAINSFGQNKTYWMKNFKKGTLYVSFVRSDSQFGTHIREYFTGTNDAYLYVVKYSQGKYKLQKKNGWSNRYYIRFSNGTQLLPEDQEIEYFKKRFPNLDILEKDVNKNYGN